VKRWVAAVVAALFLSTATLHVFTHVGAAADDGCAVCHMQQSGAVAAPLPVVAVSRVVEIVLPLPSAPRTAAARIVDAPARAPPALPA
jgi:hypothetical protein